MTSRKFSQNFYHQFLCSLFVVSFLATSCQKEELGNVSSKQTTENNAIPNQDGISTTTINERTDACPQLAIKVFLDGPFNSGTNLMNDKLRTLADFPLTSPYGTAESIGNPSILGVSGNDAIVDWVQVELRTGFTTIVTTVSGLVQRDGDVVDAFDGVSPLPFCEITEGEGSMYQVVVRHRNHLGCQTVNSYAPSSTSPPPVDLTVSTTPTMSFGGAVGRKSNGSKMTLFTGDVQVFNPTNIPPTAPHDMRIIYQGPNNDPVNIFNYVITHPSNTSMLANYIVSNVYASWDVNLDGKVIWQGPNSDRMIIFNTVISHPSNAGFSASFVVTEAVL